MNGKGDSYRPVDQEVYGEEYQRIFDRKSYDGSQETNIFTSDPREIFQTDGQEMNIFDNSYQFLDGPSQ